MTVWQLELRKKIKENTVEKFFAKGGGGESMKFHWTNIVLDLHKQREKNDGSQCSQEKGR